MPGSQDDAYRAAALALVVRENARRLDGLAARASEALAAAGIPCLLLRGAAIARWLYDDVAERPYQDVDLLVRQADHARAGDALVAMGMARVMANVAASEAAPHARTFESPDGDLDLHWTLKGVGAAPDALWEALAGTPESLELGGARVSTPPVAGRVLIVALHAAQHGPEGPAQLRDVAQAVERAPLEAWREAAGLARRLGALTWFAAGLRHLPEGAELLRRLDAEAPADLEVEIRAAGGVPMIRGLAQLERTGGTAGKLRLVARKAFPTPDFMREWSPTARRGRAGLAAAYAGRPFWMVAHAVPAYRAYRRAKRALR